jgi:tRNA (guanine37-N1)-methyltransferase
MGLVRTFCEDGRDFIRTIAKRVYDNPLPPCTGPPLSRTQYDKERRRARLLQQGINSPPKAELSDRKRIGHFVMNLPDSAIFFLGAFRGILMLGEEHDLSAIYKSMPMVHCHCFTRELDLQKAEADIRQV